MPGNTNRRAGHDFERHLVRQFKLAGFTNAATSRSESKRLDDAGVDLCWTGPFLVQAKRTQVQPNLRQLLDRIEAARHDLPPHVGNVPCVVHKKKGQVPTVTLDLADFLEIVAACVAEGIIKP